MTCPNFSPEPTAASPSAWGGAGRFAAPELRPRSVSGGCGSALRWATMNTSAFLLLAASLCVLGGGCATDGITERVIEISAVQTEQESSGHAGLSPSVATNLFYNVASRLGSLGYVNPPHQHGDPTKPTWIEYSVQFTPPGANSVELTMDIDGKHITFHGMTDTEPESLMSLQKAMKLCRDALDERQVEYKVRVFATHLTFIKS